jgi:Flp pilus assembly protein TadD
MPVPCDICIADGIQSIVCSKCHQDLLQIPLDSITHEHPCSSIELFRKSGTVTFDADPELLKEEERKQRERAVAEEESRRIQREREFAEAERLRIERESAEAERLRIERAAAEEFHRNEMRREAAERRIREVAESETRRLALEVFEAQRLKDLREIENTKRIHELLKLIITIISIGLLIFLYLHFDSSDNSLNKNELTESPFIQNKTNESNKLHLKKEPIKPEDLKSYALELYRFGRYSEAFPIFEKLAEKNDLDAEFCLGVMYDNGFGVKKDYNRSIYYLNKAAKKSDAGSQYYLGTMFEEGHGTRSIEEALRWYQLAANQNNPQAKEALLRLKKYIDSNRIKDNPLYSSPYSLLNFSTKNGAINIDGMIKASISQDESELNRYKNNLKTLDKPKRGNRKLARTLNDQGLANINKNNFTEAIQLLEQAVKADPSDPEIVNNLAFALHKNGNFDEALTAFNATLLINPERSNAWSGLGFLYAIQYDRAKSIACFSNAYRMSKNIINTHKFFLKSLTDESNPSVKSALKDVTSKWAEKLESSPNIAQPLLQSISTNQIDQEKAAKFINEMINAAILQDESGINIYKQKIKELSKPKQGNRKLARKMNDEGLTYINSNNFSEAVNILEQAAATDPADAEIINNLGHALYKNGSFSKALEALNATILINPERANAWSGLGFLYAMINDQTKSVACFSNAYRMSKNPTKTHNFFIQSLNEETNQGIKIALETVTFTWANKLQLNLNSVGPNTSIKSGSDKNSTSGLVPDNIHNECQSSADCRNNTVCRSKSGGGAECRQSYGFYYNGKWFEQ